MEMMEMAKKNKMADSGPKKETFEGRKDAGDFKKTRAAPGASAKGKAAKEGVKERKVSEAQETFGHDVQKSPQTAEEKSRKANQEFFDKHEQEDERNTEYASQREETRALRKHRQHDGRTRVKDSFIQSDGDFHDKAGFVEDAGAEVSGSKKLDKLEKKAEKAGSKTQRARKKLPQQKEYKLVRHFDEKTGKVTYELETRKVPKKPKHGNPATAATRRAMMEAQGFVHQKISENEKENAGVEGAHKTEQAGEAAIDYARRFKRDKYARRQNKVAALEKKQFKAETNFRYQKYLEENPEIKKKAFQKRLQKQRIKREYAKALKKGSEAKQAAGYARKAAQKTTNIARKLQEFARKHAGAIATIGLFGLFFMLIAASVSSCSAMFGGGITTTMAGSYQSQPAELDKADEAMTSLEMALQNEIDNIETDYPDYDEYSYNLDEIGHNPFTLINYLSATHVDVVAADVNSDIEALFDEMYELTLTPTEETRTRTVTKTRTVINEETGEEEEEEYEAEKEELESRHLEEAAEELSDEENPFEQVENESFEIEKDIQTEDHDRELTAEDIQNISYIGAEYSNFGHTAEYELEADIDGKRQTLHYEVTRHDGDEESFSIHTDENDIYDRLSRAELTKLDEKLSDEVRVGRYAQKIEKAETAEDLDSIRFEFMDDESFPRRLTGRFWEAYNAKENDFSPTPDDDLTIAPETDVESAEQAPEIDKTGAENFHITDDRLGAGGPKEH